MTAAGGNTTSQYRNTENQENDAWFDSLSMYPMDSRIRGPVTNYLLAYDQTFITVKSYFIVGDKLIFTYNHNCIKEENMTKFSMGGTQSNQN